MANNHQKPSTVMITCIEEDRCLVSSYITVKIVLRTILVIFMWFHSSPLLLYIPMNMEADANAESVPLLIDLPDFEHNSNQQFIDDVNQCVDYIYRHTYRCITPVNLELLLAQAALESGWGTSRFASRRT
jgi:hypothetical protein